MTPLNQDLYVEYSTPTKLIELPLVSVVMPTYNHERYLTDAIEGVIQQQTGFAFELIIGDDCSTDNTGAIALSYQARFPETIRVLAGERNVGMHKNHERVITAARGKYIAFCEGDDVWVSLSKLKRQVSMLESNSDISIICSNYRVISDSGFVLMRDGLHPATNRTYDVVFEEVLLSGVVLTLTVCTRLDLVKKALVESPLCSKGSYMFCDTNLWVALTLYGRCCCIPEVLCSYRRSENSATRRRDPLQTYRFVASMYNFQNDALDLYPLPQGDEATKLHKISATRSCLRFVAMLGEVSTANKQIRRLEELGITPTIKDRFLCLMSRFVIPNTLGAAALVRCVFIWRTLRYRNEIEVPQ